MTTNRNPTTIAYNFNKNKAIETLETLTGILSVVVIPGFSEIPDRKGTVATLRAGGKLPDYVGTSVAEGVQRKLTDPYSSWSDHISDDSEGVKWLLFLLRTHPVADVLAEPRILTLLQTWQDRARAGDKNAARTLAQIGEALAFYSVGGRPANGDGARTDRSAQQRLAVRQFRERERQARELMWKEFHGQFQALHDTCFPRWPDRISCLAIASRIVEEFGSGTTAKRHACAGFKRQVALWLARELPPAAPPDP